MKKKLSCIVFLALVMLVISISPIYAGNWKKDNKGWWYQENDGTYPKDDYKYVNEQWYYFDQDGLSHNGWLELNGKKYYLDPITGYMVSNETVKIDNGYYKFNENGELV